MKLRKAKSIAREIGLEVGNDLILYRNGKEVGKIYRVEGTDQYALMTSLEKTDFSDLSLRREDSGTPLNFIERGDKIRLGKNHRNASGQIAIVDEVKKWGVICYVDHPTDKNRRLYLRIKYDSFDLISVGGTIH